MNCQLSLVGEDRESLATSLLGRLYRNNTDLEDRRVAALFLKRDLGTFPQDIVENHEIEGVGLYSGEFPQMNCTGKGVLLRKDKSVYVGHFNRGEFQGLGTLITAECQVYEGHWEGGELQGGASFTQINEDSGEIWVYQGTFKGLQPDGEGEETSNLGHKYKGGFSRGQKHGTGQMRWADGKEYEGDWKENAPNGKGEMRFPDGVKLNGAWQNGAFQGGKAHAKLGSLTRQFSGFSDSSKIERVNVTDRSEDFPVELIGGEMVLSPSFSGILKFPIQNESACEFDSVTSFLNDFSGLKGNAMFTKLFYWIERIPLFVFKKQENSAKMLENWVYFSEYVFYRGEVNALNSPHGRGTIVENGHLYIGHWDNYVKTGLGRSINVRGEFYEGRWADNKPYGFGVRRTDQNKETYIGEWENGLYQGLGTLTKSGQPVSGYWDQGVLIE